MKLEIQPLVALCDEKVSIRVSGLPASEKVKISASMSLPWAKTVVLESFAWFTADQGGNVDLSKQKPDAGTYDYVDGMGLIASMGLVSGDIKDIGQNISVDENLFIDIVAENGPDRTTAKLERLFKSPDIKRLGIREEFVGDLFYTDDKNNQTIVFLGGSGSGLGPNMPVAAALASHGFNVLSLPYFGEKGLPAQLSEIPLEYFERVFKWLSENPITGGKAIQLLGMSKGAELALLLASRYPFITKVAVWAPHAYCFQGIAFKNVSSWTHGGKQLPFIQLKNRWVFESAIRGMIKNEPFTFTYTYKKGLKVAKNKEAARIKIENSNADLLLFATTDNGMWNTYDGCMQIMDTLRQSNYPHKYDLVIYEGAGEPFYVPYILPAGETTMKMAPRLVLSMGGTLKANAFTKADSWEKTIRFFKNE
ncbi:MAG TPA: acyl-CoA thioesterase/bile acid-CoA:amino acid N-acyltransferase family protein [Methanocella sp.]|uniref:acyl-CoA thioesterase/bile acid-CoA:amino acid N-acyltransferase family protein n=1 Tax=Methanocella sp. TaxID=2052833 RepID=UPI002C11612F|nr:acyl-CoA thioesterase/bile acid-CoA:amino acid N-acyltransferase family protein [Methanocella sp.]HTY89690.1 acyl-CoA thioesterase/bile acid-CoA:amino acid N-acyltransferase family protein [Methanocella sp.]